MKLGMFYVSKSDNEMQIRLDAETLADVADLLKAGKLAKKPVRINGLIGRDLTFCWFNIPLRRDDGNTNDISNDGAK